MEILFQKPELFAVFAEMHSENLPQAKFKIGEKVKIVSKKRFAIPGDIFEVNEYIISGINDTGDGIEYLLTNYPYLVWENEIEKVGGKLC